MVDQNPTTSSSPGTNNPLEFNVLEHQIGSETMQPTASQMTHEEKNSTTSMVHQKSPEESIGQQHPWFNSSWNHVPKVQQRQHQRKRMNPQSRSYHPKNLMHQNNFNQSSLQNQKNQNPSPSIQETCNDWQLDNDPRLQNTKFNIDDRNSYDSSYINMNQDTVNSSPTNGFSNIQNDTYQGIGEFIKESSQNDMDVDFNNSNMNSLLYPKYVGYGINNDTNASQPGIKSNLKSIENSSNSRYNFHCTPIQQQSNLQYIPQEQGLRPDLGFQRNSNPTFNLHCSPQQEGLISKFEIERNCYSTFNPQKPVQNKCLYSPIFQETSNVEFKPHSNLQHESSSNITSQGIGNIEENSFLHDVLRSQGPMPNLNCTFNPLGVNTTFNPHGALPTLNIKFSPSFHNSPSALPIDSKPEGAILGTNTQQDAQCSENTNALNPSHITMCYKACNISSTKCSGDSCLDLKNSHNHSSRQHYHMCNEACPSTPNGNPTIEVTPNCCSPHQHQNHSAFDKIKLSDKSCAIPAKCNYKNCIPRPGTRELDECDSDNEYNESLTPSTKKKILCLASKKLKSHRSCHEEGNDLDNIPLWIQKTIVLPAQRRGCHNITHLLMRHLENDLSFFKCGLAHIFLQDTSASLAINEISDLKVMQDLKKHLKIPIQEEKTSSCSYLHKDEQCLNDTATHIKSTMLGCSLIIPITNGFLNIGKWQVICLCEQLNYGTCHRIVVTLNGT